MSYPSHGYDGEFQFIFAIHFYSSCVANYFMFKNRIFSLETVKYQMIPCRDWGRRFMRLYPQYTSWDNSKDPERPLVIGYVSPDYFTHSVSYFIEAPLVYHDYTNYKVIVYSAVVKVSNVNSRAQITICFLARRLAVSRFSAIDIAYFLMFH